MSKLIKIPYHIPGLSHDKTEDGVENPGHTITVARLFDGQQGLVQQIPPGKVRQGLRGRNQAGYNTTSRQQFRPAPDHHVPRHHPHHDTGRQQHPGTGGRKR